MKNQAAIAIALVLGLLSMVGMHAYMKKLEQKKVGSAETVSIVAASRDIEKNDVLKPENVMKVVVSANTPQGVSAITWADRGRIFYQHGLLKKVKRGTFITDDILVPSSYRKSLTSKLAPGERAITIPVDQVSGVAGYIKPGDRVDIYCTFTVPSSSKPGKRGTEIKTYLLLGNVQVLTTGIGTGSSRRGSSRSRSSGYSSITLRVREKDAHILAFAQSQGRLTLSLRPPGDSTPPAMKDIDMNSLIEILEASAVAPIE